MKRSTILRALVRQQPRGLREDPVHERHLLLPRGIRNSRRSHAEILRHFVTSDNNLRHLDHLIVRTNTGKHLPVQCDVGERRMKLTAVYDSDGCIVVAVIEDEGYDVASPSP